MLCLSVACGRQRLHSLLRGNASFSCSPVRRESLCPPPDGCRFEKRIRDLECSLGEERRALREADALYRRLAFRRFEQTLFGQPRVFPSKRKQLLVRSALDDMAVIKHENLSTWLY